MKKWIIALTIACGVLVLGACSQNSSSDTVVQSKAGNVTKDELYNAMKEKIGNETLQQLVYEKVLAKNYSVSDKDVTAKVDEIKQQSGDNFQMFLMQNNIKDEKELKDAIKFQLLIQKASLKDIKVTDKEIKDYYDNYKPEIKARHILVADEKTAKEVKQKLDSGEKFEDVAKKYSTDTGSAQNGGDLGWFGTGQMDPDFEKSAYALKSNEISQPVKSQFGYHIIQKTGEKQKEPFEKMKTEMKSKVISEKLSSADGVSTIMKKELKNANVKIDDKDLKDALKPHTSLAQ